MPVRGRTPAVTDGLVANAFQRIPLPPSTFSIQPPGGRTLVNFETNFFTRSDQTLDRTVRLLGQRVDLRIEAHSYTWHFDDGKAITTSKPGAPYPRLQITHNYLQTGRYGPALDTTWVADYRVNGGSWRPVPGSVTIAGTPTNLRAIEAQDQRSSATENGAKGGPGVVGPPFVFPFGPGQRALSSARVEVAEVLLISRWGPGASGRRRPCSSRGCSCPGCGRPCRRCRPRR